MAVLASAAAALGALTMGVGPPAAFAAASGYSGDAYAVGTFGVRLAGQPVADQTVGRTGPYNGATPQSGEASVASFDSDAFINPGVADLLPVPPPHIQVAAIHSSVTEGADSSSASSSAATVDITSDVMPILHAEAVTNHTSASCSGDPSADTHLANLVVAGQTVLLADAESSITVTKDSRVVARVTTNKTSTSKTASYRSAKATAAVVDFPSDGALASVITGRLVVAHSESDVSC